MPRRRCVGCGRSAPKSDLLRFAAVPSEGGRWLARPDRAGTLPGRGAYLCRAAATAEPNDECLRLAARTGGLQRTLRRAVELPEDPSDAVSLEFEGR